MSNNILAPQVWNNNKTLKSTSEKKGGIFSLHSSIPLTFDGLSSFGSPGINVAGPQAT